VTEFSTVAANGLERAEPALEYIKPALEEVEIVMKSRAVDNVESFILSFSFIYVLDIFWNFACGATIYFWLLIYFQLFI